MVSLFFIGSIKRNIVNFRRKNRLRQLFEDINTIPDDAKPLSQASKSKFKSLESNLPRKPLIFHNQRSKSADNIRAAIASEDIPSIKESIKDFVSHSEDL